MNLTPPNSQRTEFIFKDQAQMDEYTLYWQQVLGIPEWKVLVSQVRGNGLAMPVGRDGQCSWVANSKLAKIGLMDPIDYPPDAWSPQDQEWTLLHELLHVRLSLFEDIEAGTLEGICLEQTIEALAGALVGFRRQLTPLGKRK